ncbi:hypothetical protein [Parapedobacter sp. DT-150]|uniref:hypothetical protein n=1 Tax=Parapedobacter sp. DT-150 TaxID=3396162 RepID=UPI003F1A6B93
MEEERIHRENDKIKREEKERLEREQEKRRSIELKAFRGLMLESQRWNEAKLIRQYIAEVESKATEKDKANPEFQGWLEWAKKKADWFDPFTEIQDDCLRKSDRDSIMNPASRDTSAYLSTHSTHESFPNRHHWPFAPWYIRIT